jgi:BirA family biotin operon repressor/biotin-[acetyl-CoA-carboxylase] ligase
MHYLFHKILDSTNEEAKRIVQDIYHNDSYVIVAETQTHGKGRIDHKWYSADNGGLYYTLLTKPQNINLTDFNNLSQLIGKKIIESLSLLTNAPIEMEWPNDLILNNKKIGGILIESCSSSSALAPKYLIVGVGLNLNQKSFPKELQSIATSIYQQTGQILNKQKLIYILTEKLLNILS